MQEAYSSLAAADEEAGRQQGAQGETTGSSSPDSPGVAHPDILSNISSSSSSNSSSPRDGRGTLAGERARRRVARAARRLGVEMELDIDLRDSPERQAQREAEVETLLSGEAPPARRSDEGVGIEGYGSNARGQMGDNESGELASSHRRASSNAVDVESTSVAFSSTVRGEKAGDDEEEEEEEAAFWTSPEGFRHVLVTGAFLGLSYAIAMAVGDLGVLLEVGGGMSDDICCRGSCRNIPRVPDLLLFSFLVSCSDFNLDACGLLAAPSLSLSA